MSTLFEHTLNNILVIPQALYGMQDVKVLSCHGESGIFYKALDQDLVDIEFYSKTPCLVYIESGSETLTNSNNRSITLQPGSMVFLPQGETLHSDYVSQTRALKAYLIFFEERVITSYLTNCRTKQSSIPPSSDFYVIKDKLGMVENVLKNIEYHIKHPNYLDLKLQELLHLMAHISGEHALHDFLLRKNTSSSKRNLQRLLEKRDVIRLSVNDLAQISSRSLSSLNRDFKSIYNVTPAKWLRDKKLAYAKDLLEGKGCSVTEAAYEVGYENVSNFIQAFKSKYNHTPNQIKTLN